MRVAGVAGRTVTLTVRFADFTTITRSRTLPEATDVTVEIHRAATRLFDGLGLQRARIRLVGVRAEGLVPRERVHRQLVLGERERGWAEADRAVDRAARRFGSAAVRPASLLGGVEAGSRDAVPGWTSRMPRKFPSGVPASPTGCLCLGTRHPVIGRPSREDTVPLSEEELRLLEQMERALVEEDPKFASTLRGTSLRSMARRRAILAGVVLRHRHRGDDDRRRRQPDPGRDRRLPGDAGLGHHGPDRPARAARRRHRRAADRRAPRERRFTVIQGGGRGRKPRRTPRASRGSFMERMEERWRRRARRAAASSRRSDLDRVRPVGAPEPCVPTAGRRQPTWSTTAPWLTTTACSAAAAPAGAATAAPTPATSVARRRAALVGAAVERAHARSGSSATTALRARRRRRPAGVAQPLEGEHQPVERGARRRVRPRRRARGRSSAGRRDGSSRGSRPAGRGSAAASGRSATGRRGRGRWPPARPRPARSHRSAGGRDLAPPDGAGEQQEQHHEHSTPATPPSTGAQGSPRRPRRLVLGERALVEPRVLAEARAAGRGVAGSRSSLGSRLGRAPAGPASCTTARPRPGRPGWART